jgi:adenylosuccinate synthase
MTKADVLDSFEELNVCTAYNVNGKETSEVPFQMSKTTIDPVYKSFPGWKVNTSIIKQKENVPETVTNYVSFINQFAGAPVKYISNGPGRDQIITL